MITTIADTNLIEHCTRTTTAEPSANASNNNTAIEILVRAGNCDFTGNTIGASIIYLFMVIGVIIMAVCLLPESAGARIVLTFIILLILWPFKTIIHMMRLSMLINSNISMLNNVEHWMIYSRQFAMNTHMINHMLKSYYVDPIEACKSRAIIPIEEADKFINSRNIDEVVIKEKIRPIKEFLYELSRYDGASMF